MRKNALLNKSNQPATALADRLMSAALPNSDLQEEKRLLEDAMIGRLTLFDLCANEKLIDSAFNSLLSRAESVKSLVRRLSWLEPKPSKKAPPETPFI